jgi:hypothetical protein
MLPCSLAAIALMSLLLYWEISKRDASVVTAQARTLGQVDDKNPSAPNAGAQTASASTPADPSVSSATQASTPSPAGRSVSEPNASVKESAAVAGSQPSSAMAEAADTNRPAAVEPPSPPPLKLQSIVYNPRRPSAMINGRILFVGDRVSEYRVVTIHADNVLLAGAGHTNLLSLDP